MEVMTPTLTPELEEDKSTDGALQSTTPPKLKRTRSANHAKGMGSLLEYFKSKEGKLAPPISKGLSTTQGQGDSHISSQQLVLDYMRSLHEEQMSKTRNIVPKKKVGFEVPMNLEPVPEEQELDEDLTSTRSVQESWTDYPLETSQRSIQSSISSIGEESNDYKQWSSIQPLEKQDVCYSLVKQAVASLTQPLGSLQNLLTLDDMEQISILNLPEAFMKDMLTSDLQFSTIFKEQRLMSLSQESLRALISIHAQLKSKALSAIMWWISTYLPQTLDSLSGIQQLLSNLEGLFLEDSETELMCSEPETKSTT